MPTLFVDDLTNIDCSILDPDRGLIGASWATDIELSGELDEQSMVFDFSKVKKTIKRIIDQEVDHKLLVPTKYNQIQISGAENLHIEFKDHAGNHIEHTSPRTAVCQIVTSKINDSDIVNFLTDRILSELPNNVADCKIMLREESVVGNYFCYSHGLKKHDGNCQRIAHGHRSQIQIWRDDDRSDKLERDLASRWKDIYLGSQEDVVEQTDKEIQFQYTTSQGNFKLSLPTDRVHLMPNDSTVECIAEHIVDLLSEEPLQRMKVKAFEGIGKGAIATR